MPSLYRRGNRLYADIKGVDGRWHQIATGCSVGQEEAALEHVEAQKKLVVIALDQLRTRTRFDDPISIVQPPPRCSRGGFVYFIRCNTPDAFVKIGWSRDIRTRLDGMRIANPHELSLVAFYWAFDPDDEESGLHEALAQHHARGEWFRYLGVERLIRRVRLCRALHGPSTGMGRQLFEVLIDGDVAS